MPEARRATTVRRMLKLAVTVAVMAVGFVFVKDRIATPITTPAVSAARVPPEFREILASRPDVAAILRGSGSAPDQPAQQVPFADVGSARELRAVRRDIRRDLAARDEHFQVMDFQGIFISGHRALAQLVYRRGHRSPATATVTL